MSRGAPPPCRRLRIAAVADVPEGSAVNFHYPDEGYPAILIHLPGGQFVAYEQRCTHLLCPVLYQRDQQRIYCPCHEGVFDPASGKRAGRAAAAPAEQDQAGGARQRRSMPWGGRA